MKKFMIIIFVILGIFALSNISNAATSWGFSFGISYGYGYGWGWSTPMVYGCPTSIIYTYPVYTYPICSNTTVIRNYYYNRPYYRRYYYGRYYYGGAYHPYPPARRIRLPHYDRRYLKSQNNYYDCSHGGNCNINNYYHK